MIDRLQLLRNVGLFDSVSSGANLPLARLTLVYAENGRGKTTLAAILRSLATGDPIPIVERRRLAAAHPPHVVLDHSAPPPAVFQNNAWNRTLPDMMVFDDVFVDQNVSSGLAVGSEHRQNLHELILGAQGVALSQRLRGLVDRIETHIASLRTKAEAIPSAELGTLSVDEFCALPSRADIADAIRDSERRLAAAREQDPVRNTALFHMLSLPAFEVAIIDRTLQEDLPSLDAAAAARVQAHVARLGPGGEAWIDEGMGHVQPPASGVATTCPFCAQDLAASPVISHYRVYFSAAYADLRRRISDTISEIDRTHGGDVPAAFERAVRIAVERRAFWSRFCDVPDLAVDTATIVRDWRTAREVVVAVLTAKQVAPLERMALSKEARAAITVYEAHGQTIATLNAELEQANGAIRVIKEQAAAANPAAILADLSRLRAVKARRTPTIATLCDDYLAEKAAKVRTEEQRDRARGDLEQYRTTVFPGYETAVNLYLQRFVAGFRLGSVTSVNTRGGSACTYNVVINNAVVPVAGGTPSPGEPSFRNTLSSGDRNTLALAFFFASLDQNAGLASMIVVIDDPISSLDEHRALTTVQEIRRLVDRTAQVIVLSHNKPFLCRIWEGADQTTGAALEVARDGVGSTLRRWDVNRDSITEHDRRHALLREYLVRSTPNDREVARALRPTLEAFCRVAYPEHFPPGALLGPFRNLCRQRIGTPQQILDARDTQELADLLEYANRFHHDTNPAWETEAINDAELLDFVRRTLTLAKR